MAEQRPAVAVAAAAATTTRVLLLIIIAAGHHVHWAGVDAPRRGRGTVGGGWGERGQP